MIVVPSDWLSAEEPMDLVGYLQSFADARTSAEKPESVTEHHQSKAEELVVG